MTEFLDESECLPNMNSCTVAGKVVRAEPLQGKTPGMAFTISYTKRWPSGGSSEIPIRCYMTGAERTEKLSWLKVGEVVLVAGEITDKNAVFGHRVERLSTPARDHGAEAEDAYLRGMS